MALEFNGLEKLEKLGTVVEVLESAPVLARLESPETKAKPFEAPDTENLKSLASEGIKRITQLFGFEKTECLSDAKMTTEIAEYISGLESLKYENWKKLSLQERQELLNKIEKKIAKIEHRPALPIKVEKMAPQTFGYQDSTNGLIALNSKYVLSDSKEAYRDVIDTIIHEGRHAYQHYNVDKKCIHESLSVVATWRENFYDPKYKYYSGNSLVVIGPNKVADVGYRLYYYQPVEIDARNFASDVMLKLKQKGFIS